MVVPVRNVLRLPVPEADAIEPTAIFLVNKVG